MTSAVTEQVAVTEATTETIRTKAHEGSSLWRISSTCFGHVASDQVWLQSTAEPSIKLRVFRQLLLCHSLSDSPADRSQVRDVTTLERKKLCVEFKYMPVSVNYN